MLGDAIPRTSHAQAPRPSPRARAAGGGPSPAPPPGADWLTDWLNRLEADFGLTRVQVLVLLAVCGVLLILILKIITSGRPRDR